MGYHVAITTEKHGSESNIPLDDWLSYVRASSDFEFETPTGSDQASEFTRSIHAARWSGADDAWLGWSHGEIWTKNPPEALIRHMIAIAPKFNARVRGDEGEFYRTADEVYYEEEGREVPWQEHEQRRMADIARHKTKRIYWNCVQMAMILTALYLLIRRHLP